MAFDDLQSAAKWLGLMAAHTRQKGTPVIRYMEYFVRNNVATHYFRSILVDAPADVLLFYNAVPPMQREKDPFGEAEEE